MYATNGRMFAHGTIMFDSDINEVVNALKVRKDKIESKGIKSIRSRVTNIKPFLPKDKQDMTTEAFREEILLKIFGVDSVDQVKTYTLTEEDWVKINEISDKYYRNWDWNYGNLLRLILNAANDFQLDRSKFALTFKKARLQKQRFMEISLD